MKKFSIQILNDQSFDELFIFIHTPFCGTCHLARKMLETIEAMAADDLFYELNASFFPEFMQENRVKSVPCLLIVKEGTVKEKIYSIESVTKIYQRIR